MPQFEQPCVDATLASDASGTPRARHRVPYFPYFPYFPYYPQIARTSQETRL